MALPPLDKTWQFVVNQVYTQTPTRTVNPNLWRLFKNSLLTFASGGWAVWYSCNHSVAGTAGDGVDRWVTDADVAWGAPNSATRSWMVLKNNVTGVQLLMCCGGVEQGAQNLFNGDATHPGLCLSPAVGFTGGATNTPPAVPSDGIRIDQVNGLTSLGDQYTLSVGGAYHLLQSTDGQCTRMAVMDTGVVIGLTFFCEYLKNPTYSPAIVGGTKSNSSIGAESSALINGWSITAALANATLGGRNPTAPNGDVIFTGGFTAEGYNSNGSWSPVDTLIPVASDLTLNFPLAPVGFMSLFPGARGRHGQFFDMWMGSGGVNNGDTYPNDTSRAFAQFRDFVLPWNGSVVSTA